MLGLEYLVCHDCDTVHAVPCGDGSECRQCGADRLDPIPTDAAAAAYFAPGSDG